jgi:hypothetical protein
LAGTSTANDVIKWFETERGISTETLGLFGVGIRPDGAVTIPYASGTKIRRGIPHGERAFFFEGDLSLFPGTSLPSSQVILVEGETDTMRLTQELRAAASPFTAVGLPGIETWRQSFAEALAPAENVYVILDNDKDYMVQGRVDHAWTQIRGDLGRKARRVRLPNDCKDICEFFAKGYTLGVLKELIETPVYGSVFSPLDLTSEPPPVRWLVDGMFCLGDVNLLLGEPGIGKSWLSMALAVAIVQGTPWLGRKTEQGRVLYVDEENSVDLVYDRLRKLGLSMTDAPNLRYLSNEGILLDRHADKLVDEALDYQPVLIVLDALTRFHSGDEDKAGSMSQLYNNALKPLARQTGATVLLLHHAGKTESNSSYRRSRGSGEIIANADAGFDVRQTGINALSIANFKSRRKQMGETINVIIQDTPEGGVRLVGGSNAAAVF